MLSSPYNRRNNGARRIVSTLGNVVITASVAYGTYRFANWLWDSWKHPPDKDNQHLVQQNKSESRSRRGLWRIRRQRLDRCRLEVLQAMLDFLPTLRRSIESLTDISIDTKALKELRNKECEEKRRKEKELWNSIKTKTLTRLISTAYGHTMLFLILTTQVHLMSGKLFQEQQQLQNFSGMDDTDDKCLPTVQESNRFVLTETYEYFLRDGLHRLVTGVERSVQSVVHDWDVTDASMLHVSKEMLEKGMEDIRQHLEGESAQCTYRRHGSMFRLVLPREGSMMHTGGMGSISQDILDETFDIFESPVFEDAQKDCLSATFDILRDQIFTKVFTSNKDPKIFVSHPLATVLSKLKNASNSFYVSTINFDTQIPDERAELGMSSYLSEIQRLPTVLELADVSFS
jgi:peroxin-3